MNSSSISEKFETIFPPGLSLGPGEMDIAFPFNFIIDSETRVVRVGPAIRRLLPNFVGGERLDRTFKIKRPVMPVDFHDIREHGNQLFLLEVRSLGKLTLKGQMLHLPQANAIIFLGAPWLTESADIGALGLSLNDFAIHDSVPDYLYLMRAQKTSVADAVALAEQLSALNNQLERRVEERTREVVSMNSALTETNRKLEGEIIERKQAGYALLAAKESAEEATKLKDKFIVLVSHDLKTPLSSMIGFLSLVREDLGGQGNEGVNLILDRAIDSGKQMVNLIDDLLDVSRISTGQVKLNKKFFDAKQLGAKMITDFSYLSEQKGIEIKDHLPSEWVESS